MSFLLSYPDPMLRPHAFFTYITQKLLELPPTRFYVPYSDTAPRYGALALLLHEPPSGRLHYKGEGPEPLFLAANRLLLDLRITSETELLDARDEENIHNATTWTRKKLEVELDATAKAQILNSQQKYCPPNLRRASIIADSTGVAVNGFQRGSSEGDMVRMLLPPPTRGPFSPVNGQFQHRALRMDRRHSVEEGPKQDVYANFKSKGGTKGVRRSYSIV